MSARNAGVLACFLFVVSCSLAYGGLFSHAYPGDVLQPYALYGRELVKQGLVPYRDFYDEFPPGSVPVFAAPAAIWNAHYVLVFKLLMAACGVGLVACAAWTVARLRLSYLRLAPVVLAPMLMGPVFLNRYDPLPAFLTSLALVFCLRSRARTTGALLGVDFAVKLYGIFVAPLAWRRLLPERKPAVVAGVVAAAILILPFVALGPGGVRYSYWSQAKRHLQIESLGSSLLLPLSKLGLHHEQWIPGKPGSIDLSGTVADAVGTLTSLLALALVAGVCVRYWRGHDTDARLVTAWAAAVAAWTVFGKVLSPQYLTWLVALVPLAPGRKGLYAAAALLGALALTQPEYFLGDHGLRDQNWTVWLLLARNALLVASFVFLWRGLGNVEGERHARVARPA